MLHKCRVNQILRINYHNRYIFTKSEDKASKREFIPNSKTRIIKRAPKEKNIVQQECEAKLKLDFETTTGRAQNENVGKSVEISPELRLNEINVQMLSKSISNQIFNNLTESETPNPDIIKRCQRALHQHGMKTEDCPLLPNVNFTLPKLQGNDILEHFYNIGENQSAPYRNSIEKLIKDDIPPIPKKWVFKPGWHQYGRDGVPVPVHFPPEDALVFDVEVCMSAGTNPTLACAVSATHWYGWVSQTLVDGSAQPPDTIHYGLDNLVPLESVPSSKGYKLRDDVLKPKLIVGHNVSYDRARIKEQYWLERTGTRFMDTMSMHVCVSGVTSYQRTVLKSNKEVDPEDESWMQISSLNSLAEVHKLYCGKEISKEARNTFVEGSLDDVRNDFQILMDYCAGDVSATSSVLRILYPLFKERFPHPVTLAGMLELGTAYLPVNSNWTEYINSADLTYKDIELECKFLLARKAEKACRLMHDEQYTKDLWMWDQDWSTQELKLKNEPRTRSSKKTKENKEQITEECKSDAISDVTSEMFTENLDGDVFGSFDFKGEFRQYRINNSINILNAKKDIGVNSKKSDNKDDINTENDLQFPDPLENKFKYLYEKASLLPVKRPLLPGYPAWHRKLCTKPSKDEENWVPGPHHISTSMQITPKLLSLSWEGYPLHYIRGQGWGFLVPYRKDRPSEDEMTGDEDGDNIPFETLVEKCPVVDLKHLAANSTQSEGVLKNLWKDVESDIGKRDYYSKRNKDKTDNVYKGTGVWSGVTLGGACFFMRLPHKDGASKNVGNPLAKDFINKFSENVLNGEGLEAEKVLTAARMLSYWRNNRDRIRQQKVVWFDDADVPSKLRNLDKKYGAILPQVVVCGTLTRRAMEPTWMTASNAHKERIGSELRAMIQCPPGYNFVGADVDSQELWIAAILGDSQFGLHGATPFGWMTLAGSKAAGTDMHSHTAKAAQITRDHAKVINYARIYGAGQNFAERLLKQFNPSMSDGDAKNKALKMFTTTKGRRYYRLKAEWIERVFGDNDYTPAENELTMLGYHATKIAKANGKELNEMFEKPKWIGGTESDMFNRLEEIAGSEKPRTPFLSCQLTRALMSDEGLRKRHLPTAVNWVVQSGAVDFLHLMLVNMVWLTGSKARFCLSFHDEVRYMVPEQYKYETALALHVTNLYTRAFCSKRLGLNDLPQSVAFFTSVDVDTSLRKEAHLDCVTPSNPHGLAVGYGVPAGEALDIQATLEKCPSGLGKLYKKESKKNKESLIPADVSCFNK